jgi:hypothetical protein
MRSVVDVKDERAETMTNDVFGLLSARAVMISPILDGPAKTRGEMLEWSGRYRELVRRLERRLRELEIYLSTLAP